MIPYKYNKKDEIWQLRSICEFCKKEKCDFKQSHLTGCTEFSPQEQAP